MEQIILNLVPGGVSPVCYVSQYDVGRKIRLHLRNGSDPYVLSGAETVAATIRKVSGEELIYDIANTSASYVDLIVNYDATDVIGESVCELIITESGLRIGSANFKMRIDPDVYSGDQKLEVVSATSENPNLSFETNVEENLLELKAGFSPVQDLHGYDSPWIDSNVVNKKPYLMRAIAGTASRIGTHEYNKIVGGTVAFNQIVKNGNFADSSNWIAVRSTLSVSNNVGTITKSDNDPYIEQKFNFVAGHKYLYNADLKANNGTVVLSAIYDNESVDRALPVSDETWTNAAFIITPATTGTSNKERYRITLRTGDTAQVKNTYLIDLTQMFGSTIADYIYSLEQATAGAGVAWFKALFPKDYYAYNAGELMSVKATAHVMKNASNTVIGSYALDSNLVLNGLFKLDANNKLYADGDTYESSGAVGRNYKKYTFTGEENWSRYREDGSVWFTETLADALYAAGTFVICSAKYVGMVSETGGNILDNYPDKSCALQNITAYKRFYVKDSAITSAAEMKAAMAGLSVVYPLATPTTEQASPFTNPQVCDENGTEEYTDNRAVAIPVGHETYQANICPISGYTEANITRCGVNLWDEEWEQGGINGTTGLNNNESNCIRSKNYIRVYPGQTLYCHVGATWSYHQFRGRCYKADGTYLQALAFNDNSTFTMPSDCYLLRFVTPANEVVTTYGNNISFNYPATDTAYHPYNGQTYAISFGQTVYGGVLDVTRGKLHVTWGYAHMSELEWIGVDSPNGVFQAGVPNFEPPSGYDERKTGFICNIYTASNVVSINSSMDDKSLLRNSGRIYAHDTDYNDVTLFKNSLASAYLAFELATPFDIDLTSAHISAIVGINNLMHDANGGTEVKFFRMISAS